MFGILLNHSSRFLGRKCPKSQPGSEREAESPADFQLERELKEKKIWFNICLINANNQLTLFQNNLVKATRKFLFNILNSFTLYAPTVLGKQQ